MGFDPALSARAVRETGGSGLQQAIDWILEGPQELPDGERAQTNSHGADPVGPLAAASQLRDLSFQGSPYFEASGPAGTHPSPVSASGPGMVGVAGILQREQIRAAAANE